MVDSIKHANIEITNQCNQKCFYCFNNSGQARKDELSLDTWLEVLNIMKNWGLSSILVTGGEPFIRPGIMDFIGEVQAMGIETSILSNGYKIPEFTRTHRDVLKKLKVAQISLDAMNPNLHDARRGVSGAWKQATDAIKTLNCLGIPIEISCTVSDENIDEVKKVGEYCKSIGAKLLIRSLVNVGRAVSVATSDCINNKLKPIVNSLTAEGIECVSDAFFYNPAYGSIDNDALEKGVVTIQANGAFRVGPIAVCGISSTNTALALLKVA